MNRKDEGDITHLLIGWKAGDPDAMDKLMGAVYDRLKEMARRYTVRENPNNTLNTTGLVHEAYLRIVGQNNKSYQNRAHFYAILSTCMRRVILEVARAGNAQKRGGGVRNLELEDYFAIEEGHAEQILGVNDALEKLETFDPRLSKIVEYRYFGGLKLEEIAEALDCSLSTVKRDWRVAKAWLHSQFEAR